MGDEELAVSDLVEEAADRAGLSPSHVAFTENLELLVGSCRRSGKLTDTGLTVLRKAALRHLRNLMELGALVDAHPEVGERPLPAPLVVTGMPRTGTTLLHNLLALDPSHRPLRFWEALRPVPSARRGASPDELVEQAERWLEAFYGLVPEFRAIHAATATGPEECDALLQNSFASQHFDDMFDAHEYSAWLAEAPLTDEYAHYSLQLRALSGDSAPGPTWLLKSPSHLGHLDALLAALPGVTVVVCHRPPTRAVSSYASLILALRRPYSQNASAAAVGRQALRRASVAMGRHLEVRDNLAHAHAFIDVSYGELVREPIAVVREIYRHVGRVLEADVEDQMREWLSQNPQHKHGTHPHSLGRFGLTEDEVDSAFASYRQRFGAALGC